MFRLGVVSFLNARPLIAGLDRNPRVQMVFDVPAALPTLLDRREVDAALVPVIDVLRSGGRYRVVSDACIGCDGETMTVRVFSQVPPDRVRTLWVDPDSHTSVLLAQILWRELYVRDLALRPLDTPPEQVGELEAVLLIGDKVVNPERGSFAYEVDLGGAWRQHTGLPFVFAVWATTTAVRPVASQVAERPRAAELTALLSQARDRGVAGAAEIAASCGPAHGWPIAAAHRYLTRCLMYKLDARAVEGMRLFTRYAIAAGLIPPGAEILWPSSLAPKPTGAVS